MLHNYHYSLLLWHILPRYELVYYLDASHETHELIGNLGVCKLSQLECLRQLQGGVQRPKRASTTILESH